MEDELRNIVGAAATQPADESALLCGIGQENGQTHGKSNTLPGI